MWRCDEMHVYGFAFLCMVCAAMYVHAMFRSHAYVPRMHMFMHTHTPDDFPKAIESLEHVYKSHPKNYDVQRLLGSLYGRMGKHIRAHELLYAASQQEPNDVELLVELGQVSERIDAQKAYAGECEGDGAACDMSHQMPFTCHPCTCHPLHIVMHAHVIILPEFERDTLLVVSRCASHKALV